MDQDGFDISECNSHVDDGWKMVLHKKRNRKQNPALGSLEEQDEDRIQDRGKEADEIVERKENLKAEETKKAEQDEDRRQGIPAEKTYEEADEIAERKENLKAELSILKAMKKIDASKLSTHLSESAVLCQSSPAWQLTGMLDCVGGVLTIVEVPWVKMFEKPSLFEMYNFPLSQIPKPFYDTIVKWIKVYEDGLRAAFVMWGSDLLLEHLVATQQGREGRITCRSKDAIFIVLAILLRWRPFTLIFALPSLRDLKKKKGQEKIRLIVWMIAQVSQGDLSLGLYSWVNNLLPVAASCNSESRELILQLVEKILSDPDAPNMLLRNRAVPKARLMVPPSEFEMLVRLAFPASRRKDTARFEKIYHSLKEVALPVIEEEIGEIFTLCLKFAGEGDPVLAKEATSIAILCLIQNFVYCCNRWDKLYKENLKASVALLQELVHQWKRYLSLLGRKAKKQVIGHIFRFSLKFAGEGNPVLAREATSIAMLCLTKSFVDCCNHWDKLYEENLKASVALFQMLVHKWKKDHSLKLSSSERKAGEEEKKQVIGHIFRFSLKFAGEGNPVLAREATSIAMLCLTKSFVDCCNHWDKLYEENLKASVALLRKLVHKWKKDHSLKLSSSEMKQVTGQIFRFSLKFAGERDPVLARKATSIAMLCLTESFVDCCNYWDKLYEENLKASVALLQELVHQWKDHSLKLSSSSDTLNRTMESFRLKNKKGIAQGRCNFSLYKEADKLCKMIRCKIIISRGSGKEADKSYKFAFTAVVLALALVLVTVPISVGIWV